MKWGVKIEWWDEALLLPSASFIPSSFGNIQMNALKPSFDMQLQAEMIKWKKGEFNFLMDFVLSVFLSLPPTNKFAMVWNAMMKIECTRVSISSWRWIRNKKNTKWCKRINWSGTWSIIYFQFGASCDSRQACSRSRRKKVFYWKLQKISGIFMFKFLLGSLFSFML